MSMAWLNFLSDRMLWSVGATLSPRSLEELRNQAVTGKPSVVFISGGMNGLDAVTDERTSHQRLPSRPEPTTSTSFEVGLSQAL
jgi:predicted dinucleotide-utilizing enzyme